MMEIEWYRQYFSYKYLWIKSYRLWRRERQSRRRDYMNNETMHNVESIPFFSRLIIGFSVSFPFMTAVSAVHSPANSNEPTQHETNKIHIYRHRKQIFVEFLLCSERFDLLLHTHIYISMQYKQIGFSIRVVWFCFIFGIIVVYIYIFLSFLRLL